MDKSHTILGKIMLSVLYYVARPVVRLIWLGRLTGLENLPKKGAYIVAANHQSYLDFILIMAVVPRRVTFLAAEKFFSNPIWRPLVEYTGQIKVERESTDKSASVAAALKVLASGEVIALFPQGTRSRDGQIGKTFTGVVKLALSAGVPVVPIGLEGAYEAWPPHGKLKFNKRVTVSIGSIFKFHKSTTRDKAKERQLTNEVMSCIAELSNLTYEKE